MDHRLPALVALCLAGAPLVAAIPGPGGDDINDLRGSLGFPPDYGVDGSSVDISGGVRIGVQGMRNFTPIDARVGGWIYGAEASLSFFDDHHVDGTILAFTGLAGYAYRLQKVPQLHFEGTPFLGLGLASYEVGNDGQTDLYLEFGLRAAAFWTFASHWQAGFDLRLMATDADKIDSNGVMPSLVGGYRF